MSNKLDLNIDKLTFNGSLNYIVQVNREVVENGETIITVNQYQPRINIICTGEFTEKQINKDIKETIERMKIAINQFQEFLDGTRDNVYYWELENERELRK